MFCPKCGTGEQTSESYCRNCGVWLTDPDAASAGGIFRKTTREEKIRKIRTLELVSIGLSLTSAMIIFSFLFGSLDRGLLFLAMSCGIVVAVYQAVNMYLGHRITLSLPHQRSRGEKNSETASAFDMSHNTPQLTVPASVTDNTTELLEPDLIARDRSKKD